MELAEFCEAMVKAKNITTHNLSPLVHQVEKDPAMLRLIDTARTIGYSVAVSAGVLEHDHQIDEFIDVSVRDSRGEDVPTYDGGYLTSYEPVFVHFRNGKEKKIDDWLAETLIEIENFTKILLSGCFVIAGDRLAEGTYESEFGPIEVRRSWKEGGCCYGIIKLLNKDDPSFFPKIGDEMMVGEHKMIIFCLADDPF